jgi:superfamily II DNA or RNA helicase
MNWLDGLPEGDRDGLTWYQREAVDSILKAFETHDSTLLVLATGLGKTQVFTALAKEWTDRDVLILAHRDELVSQAAKRYEQMTNMQVDIEQGDLKASLSAHIVVGSVQTVQRQGRLDRLGKERFGLVIFDEGHHAVSPTFRRPLEFFSSAKQLLVTATPDRLDGQSMKQLVQGVAYQMDILDGVRQGYLVPADGERWHLDTIDLTMVDKTAGDLRAGQLDEAMLKATEGIVRKVLEHHPDKKAIVFTPGVRSGEFATARFNALAPDSTAFISGTTPYWVRRQIVADFKAGKYVRLVNCQIATEGFDCPDVDMIVMGRPTCSRALYAQMAGRGFRAPPEVFSIDGKENDAARQSLIAASNKPRLLILDFVGNSGKHSLATPEDILGGEMEPAVVERAKKIRKEGSAESIADVLKRAKLEVDQAAKDIVAHVEATCQPFDPFKVFGVDFQGDKYTHSVGYSACSPQQLNALTHLGVNPAGLEGMGRKAATRLLQEFNDRRKKGYCTFKQLEILQKHGIKERDIFMVRATEAIDYLAATGWGRRTNMDKLKAICEQDREPGSEG